MNYRDYPVKPEFVTGTSIRWSVTGNGEYILGVRKGRTWFIKRDMHLRYPAKGIPKAVYDVQKAAADEREAKQRELRARMKALEWKRDGVVSEEENFWDESNMFVTVTPFIADILPDDADLSAMSAESFVAFAHRAACALAALHACRVIHGDLKEKNFVVVADKGEYKPYLVDFDMSYPADRIPAWDAIAGSDGYRSPELILYSSDEGAAAPETITAATDVFSLAVVLHRWWTGSFPAFDLERGSLGAAVYLGKRVQLSRKFDVRIGEKSGATLLSLLNWMICKNAEERPTAQQVAEVLADEAEVPEEYREGHDLSLFDEDLWSAHALMAELYTKETLRRKGIRSLRRVNDGSGSEGLYYELSFKDGATRRMTVRELCEEGYARRKKGTFCEPWEAHRIEFADPDAFFSKGYVRIERAEMGYRKRYLLTGMGGRTIDKGVEWLIAEGLAKPLVAVVKADTPWPEHGSRYVAEALERGGVESVSRVEVGGEHRYKIVYRPSADGVRRVNDKVPGNNMKLMGYIR